MFSLIQNLTKHTLFQIFGILNIQLGVLYEKSNYYSNISRSRVTSYAMNVTKHQITYSPNGHRNRRNPSDI